MHNNLECVQSYAQALETTYKKKAYVTPFVTMDLMDLKEKKEGRTFFGIISFASNCITNALVDENDQEIIIVQKNSQIMDFFSWIKIKDVDLNDEDEPLGHFRGFEIQLR